MKMSFLTKNTDNKPNLNYKPPASKNDHFYIDAAIARRNYEEYQNNLKKHQQDLIKKWDRKIIEASSMGKKLFMTNCFVTDDDKNKILFLLDDANCCIDFPSDATLQYFQQYYEDKGFEVIKIEYAMDNVCCLQISWID